MTITINEHFMLVQKAMKRFLEEGDTSIYHELVADEQAYWANIQTPGYWPPDLPLDQRTREAIGKLIAKIVIAQAEWYVFNSSP